MTGLVIFVPCPECDGMKDSRAARCATCAYDPVLRFWRSVHKTDTCWVWTGKTIVRGYGRMRIGDKRKVLAHRFSYELHHGTIPEGLTIDHLCRNPRCVNPAHLEPVTHRENVLRGTSPAAAHARQSECKHGHPFTLENTYIIPSSGGRQCLTCKRAGREREWHRRLERRDACSRKLGLPA